MYFNDFERDETYSTSSRTITEADQLNYAGLSGNFHPIHLDEKLMSESRFGGRLVYGYLVLNVLEGLKVQAGISENVVAFYGLDNVRFTAPTMIGDTIHGEITVVDLEERDDGGIVVLEEKAVNQDDEDVLIAETRTLYEKHD